jgi:hypothetical protein
MKSVLIMVGAAVGVVALVIGLSALFALPVMLLWNYVMPYQFDVKEIDFLHAWALNVLIGITVKGNGISYSDKKK